MTPAEQIAYLRRTAGDDPEVLAAIDRLAGALLPDERVEHRLARVEAFQYYGMAECLCGDTWTGTDIDDAVRAWAAHAGIGGTE